MRRMAKTIKGVLVGLIVGFCALFIAPMAEAQFDPENIRAVDQAATGANDGQSWEDAYTDLQDALEEAEVNQNITSIWVAQGVYVPSVEYSRGGGTLTLA